MEISETNESLLEKILHPLSSDIEILESQIISGIKNDIQLKLI